MKELFIKKVEDWKDAASMLLDYAEKKRKFVFTGEIGAGKTTFIQAICARLGVKDSITSPTFALVNEYIGKNCRPETVYHLDLYRLKDIDEALNIGIEDFLYGPSYCFIEWPEVIEPMLSDEEIVRIQIEIVEDSTRKVLFL